MHKKLSPQNNSGDSAAFKFYSFVFFFLTKNIMAIIHSSATIRIRTTVSHGNEDVCSWSGSGAAVAVSAAVGLNVGVAAAPVVGAGVGSSVEAADEVGTELLSEINRT